MTAVGLTVEFGGVRHDVIVELPYGATVAAMCRAFAAGLPDLPVFVSAEVRRTGVVLPSEAVVLDCDVHGGDRLVLRHSSPPVDVSAVSLRARDTVTRSEPQVRLRKTAGASPVTAATGPALARLLWVGGGVDVPQGELLVGSSAWADIRVPDVGAPELAFEIAVDSAGAAQIRTTEGGPSISVGGTVLNDGWNDLPRGVLVRAGKGTFVLADPDNVAAQRAPSRRMVIGDGLAGPTRIDLGSGGAIAFNRPPRRSTTWRPARISLPSPPDNKRRIRLPLLAALVPLIGGLVMFLLMHSAMMLGFMALSPLMVGGSYISDRRAGGKDHRSQVATFEARMVAAAAELESALALEAQERNAQAPDLATLARRADAHDDRLWERRPWDGDFLALRVGLATLPAQAQISVPKEYNADHNGPAAKSVEGRERVEQLAAQFQQVPSVPYLVRLSENPVVGLSGDRRASVDLARSLVLQAAALHSPSDLGIVAILPPGAETGWEWLKWIGHTRTAAGLLDGPALATGRNAVDVLRAVRDMQRQALADRSRDAFRSDDSADAPALLLVIDEQLQLERSLVAEVLTNAAGLRTGVLWIGRDQRGLPGQCRVRLDVAADETAMAVEMESGQDVGPIRLEGASTGLAEQTARALAPLRDATSASGSAGIPARLRLLDQLGLPAPTAEQIAERWQRPRKGLGATIGMAAGESVRIDLRADGPHTLIAGTTGAGKSELLRTIIASLAAEHPPSRLAFLLIDYKGGAAFSPCLPLPHVLDVVSDLDAEMGERALVSLDAEMKRRERILAEYKADNLIDLERRHPDIAPPNLVIMVDEFAKLREEIPDFVDGVVDVAQRGRTLGIHMVLAAQSLRTAFTPAVRANTNLRIALRVTSDTESQDVIDSSEAARIPSGEGSRGRAFARIGHERLVEFQTAHVSARYLDPTQSTVVVRPFGFSAVAAPSIRRRGHDERPPGSDETDLAALVRATVGATDLLGLPTPRPAWTDPLPAVLARSTHQSATDVRTGVCAFGLIDEPRQQRQVPLTFDLDRGHAAIWGVSGTGKTTAIQTIVASLASGASPDDIHMYLVDGGTGGLTVLTPLPHVAAVVPVADAERVERMLERLERLVRERSALFGAVGASSLAAYREATGESPPRIVLAIDGFGEFATQYDNARSDSPYERLGGLLASGRPVGVSVILTADRRQAIRSTVASQIQQRLVLRLATPDDLVGFGVPSRLADQIELGPGRGFTQDSLIAQIALPVPAQDLDLADGFRALGAHLAEVWPERRAPEIQALPEEVGPQVLVGLPTAASRLPVALGGPDLTPQPIDVSERHFFVIGDYKTGRSSTLATIGEQLATLPGGPELILLSPRRSDFTNLDCWTAVARGGDDCSRLVKEFAAQVEEFDESAEPVAYLVIDDAGEIQDTQTMVALEKIVRLGRDRGVRVIAAAETSAARMMTNLWIRELRRDAQGLLLCPDLSSGGDVLGAALPRRSSIRMVAGRGFLISRGRGDLVQMVLPRR